MPRTSSGGLSLFRARSRSGQSAARRGARRSRLRDAVLGNPGECGHGALRKASAAAAAGDGPGAAHGAGGPAPARRRSGIVDPGDAGHGASPEGRRPNHRVLESPRLCAEPVLQCLRLGRPLRALRRAHDFAPPRESAALPSLRRARPRPRDLRQLRPTIESRGPGHRARRGNLGAIVPAGAAGQAGSRHGVRARRGANRARPRAQRRGADTHRHSNADQGPPLPRGQLGGDPGCRSGAVRQRFSRHRTPRPNHHPSRRPRGARSASGGSLDSNRVSGASAAQPAAEGGLRGVRGQRPGRAPRGRLAALFAARHAARGGQGQRRTGCVSAGGGRCRPAARRTRRSTCWVPPAP